MALSNYGELKTSVANWLGRSDLTTPIIDFITLAHKQLMRDLRGHLRLQKRDTAFSITGEYVDAPTDFLELISIRITSTDPDYELEYLPGAVQSGAYSTSTGIPKFVSLVGDTTAGTENFRFAPAPSSTYTATIEYYASITYFASDAGTNWILTDHPQLYLYGALLQASGYIGDDPRIPMWKQAYDEALAKCMAAGARARYGVNGMMVRAG